jgi:hypothetical protein
MEATSTLADTRRRRNTVSRPILDTNSETDSSILHKVASEPYCRREAEQDWAIIIATILRVVRVRSVNESRLEKVSLWYP